MLNLFFTIIVAIIALYSAFGHEIAHFSKYVEYGGDILLPCPYFEKNDQAKWYKGANSTKLLASIVNGTINTIDINYTVLSNFSLICHNVLSHNVYTCESTSRKGVMYVQIKVKTEIKTAIMALMYCHVELEITPPHLVDTVAGFNAWPKQKGKTCNSTNDPSHNQEIFPVKKWTNDIWVLDIPKENVSGVMCLETIYHTSSFQSFQHQEFSPKNITANINVTSAILDSMHYIVTLGISPTYLKPMVSQFNVWSKQKGVTCQNISNPNHNHDVQIVAVKEWKKIDSGFVLNIPKENVSSVMCLVIKYKDFYQPIQYLNISVKIGPRRSRAGKMAAGELIIPMATMVLIFF